MYLERKYNKFKEGLKYPARTYNYNVRMPEQKELREFKQLHDFYLSSDYRISELSKRISVSPRTINRWLNCQTKPDKDKLKEIRKYLDKKKLYLKPKMSKIN